MADQVLNLDTLVERPQIRIDGTLYDILSPDELSILDHHRLARTSKRMDALMSKEPLAGADADELPVILREVSDRIMVGVPGEVRSKLTDSHRLEVVEVFTVLQRRRRMAMLQMLVRPIGDSSPRGFNGSTAAIPPGGSKPPPSASSAPIST